jgi:hypothetical protein
MTHKIYPHSLPEKLIEGVWRVKGGLSFPLNRNMIVLRLAGGELLLHSAVAVDEPCLKALEALGKPAYAVVPHSAHGMDAPFYAARYPEIKVVTPAIHREKVATRVPVAGTMEDVLPGLGFVLHDVPATRTPEYVLEWQLPSGGRMLVVNDAMGSADMADSSKLMGRLMIAPLGTKKNRLGMARIYQMSMAKDVAALKRFYARLAEIPDLRLLTVSHGEPVSGDVAAALKAAAG